MRCARTAVLTWILAAGFAACSPDPALRDSDYVVGDKELEAQVRWAITHDNEMPQLRLRDIKVDCVKGAVVISGVVNSVAERERVDALARSPGGVRNVVIQLEVRFDGP